MSQTFKKTIRTKDGVNLYYEVYITERQQPTVFFVHGAGGDLDAWQYIKDELLKKGFSSIAMDIRGHGYSSHPRSFASYHIDNFVGDIVAILDAEKIEKIFLAGHSFGAVVVTQFALEHQTRLKGLAIISGTDRGPSYLSSRILTTISRYVSNALALISLPPISPGHSIYPPGKFHKEYEWKGLAKTILRNSWGSYLLTNQTVLALDIESRLGTIKVPTLVIVGEKDTIFPTENSKNIHRHIKNSKLVVIEGANHVVVLNNIREVSNALQGFLQQL
jgi:pimeloyl-ACP methyl ester carboxylesterase